MQTTEIARVAASPADVFPFVADLARYPAWMPLVHDATPVDGGGRPAWNVEIRARIGPFARSKRLRMERTELVPDQLAVFERAETDGRDHAGWVLRVELRPDSGAAVPDSTSGATATEVTMHLAYDGSLWTGGPLARVFDEQVRRGRDGLVAAVGDRSV
ncbi:polyketide cyclase/dehydrase/lipid transport protein [Ilumatobacter fluminis]|uniref:Polyketide cyclase/dehydrase/lipid transport protein n=1 Tax=Ilumatobacter fluminis TaxID=467091 RepID=A0A4R7I1M5_9ACTN|nr:SRPBCC family protein [Ilumatobacter fluminis]TDT16769.1 polyketide cyclase/dehydrase/lipid transport protein [Ilumatobacter fluminis]